MKTAEQWLDSEQWHETGDAEILQQIKQIQLDAWRQGMMDAAKLVTDGSFIHELAPDSIMARSISKLILHARDTQPLTPPEEMK